MISLVLLLCCCLFPLTSAVVQCLGHNDNGCSPPLWDVRWDMAGSGYIYCWDTCPMEFLYNISSPIGRFGGVVGVDHYWTHQGMPCINGIPQEFAMQDLYAAQQKQRFPRIKVLQYRITDAVPYAQIVHDKMMSDPAAFVRWQNGSICEMPSVERKTEGFNCSWEVRAAAYDWSQQRVQDWYIENIIKPTINVADGSWIDNDGPDNGAWMCSGQYDYGHLPAPYPALNESQIADFCAGEEAVVTAAHEWLIPHGGYDYNCFTFIRDNESLPTHNDTADVCSSKLQKLDHRAAKSAVVLYTDRTNRNRVWDDSNVKQYVAIFLLTRAEHWFFGYPTENQLNMTTATYLLSDYGGPLSNMTRPDPRTYVFQRKYEKATIQFDCSTFTADFLNNNIPETVQE